MTRGRQSCRLLHQWTGALANTKAPAGNKYFIAVSKGIGEVEMAASDGSLIADC